MQKQNGIVQQRGSWQLQTADRNGRWTYLLFFNRTLVSVQDQQTGYFYHLATR